MTARAMRWSCSRLGEWVFAHRLVPSACGGGLPCAPVQTTASTRRRRRNGVVMLSAAKHLASVAIPVHRLVPLGCRRCLQELPLACGERVPFFAPPKKGTKERRPPARRPLRGCVRRRPVPRRCIPAPARQGRDPSRPSCGPFGRRRTAARGEPELCGFSPPSARRTPKGSARRASARGEATRLRPAKGRRAEPNALGRSRGRGDLASARCASLGTLARRTPGMAIGAPRRRPRTRAAGATAGGRFFGHLSFKRKWPARRQPSGTGRDANGTADVRCPAAQTLRCAQDDNRIKAPQASEDGGLNGCAANPRRSRAEPGGVPMAQPQPDASLHRPFAALRVTTRFRVTTKSRRRRRVEAVKSRMPRCADPSRCSGRLQKLARPARAMRGAPRDE